MTRNETTWSASYKQIVWLANIAHLSISEKNNYSPVLLVAVIVVGYLVFKKNGKQ